MVVIRLTLIISRSCIMCGDIIILITIRRKSNILGFSLRGFRRFHISYLVCILIVRTRRAISHRIRIRRCIRIRLIIRITICSLQADVFA